MADEPLRDFSPAPEDPEKGGEEETRDEDIVSGDAASGAGNDVEEEDTTPLTSPPPLHPPTDEPSGDTGQPVETPALGGKGEEEEKEEQNTAGNNIELEEDTTPLTSSPPHHPPSAEKVMPPPSAEKSPLADFDQSPAAPPPADEEVADKQEEAVPEKLADDDEKREPLYKRAFFAVFPQLRRVEDRRRVFANDLQENRRFKYANNVVITSKYNLITFLPRNLFEQFLRVANTYFLILLIIQLIPGIASVPFYSTLVPLVGVLGVTAVKDAYDDIKRHISDWKVNNRPARVLRHVEDKEELQQMLRWKHVKVGDVVRLEKDDFITADMLVLSSSEPNSLVYIETAELDGETNLKVRQPVPETAKMEEKEDELARFDGYIECEPPNNRLNKFVGTLTWEEHDHSLSNDQIVLRGCRLRNTKWMYGVVIYAGHDTKLVQNSGTTKFKRTHIDLTMNIMVLFILGFLGVLVGICWLGSLIYEITYGAEFTVYVPYYNSLQDHPAEIAFLQILSNIVVLNTLVPISLYVSVEVIRLGLSLLINWDNKMYYEPNDVPAQARSTALNEELGQIEYIFSDKTGTLTRNIMTFHKCSIRGVKYGEVRGEEKLREQVVSTGEIRASPQPPAFASTEAPDTTPADTTPADTTPADTTPIDFYSWNSFADCTDFAFYDRDFLEKCRRGDPDIEEFFRILALCHTVLPAEEDGKLIYNAQSPDEAALVSAARNFGYVFKERSPFTITLRMLHKGEEGGQGTDEVFEVLNILDFNNERKRMSVIVKYDERITLYCKGADSVVFARLNEASKPLMDTTIQHLGDYAREGLRTLVLAKKELTLDEYAAWATQHHAASIVQENRDQEVDKVYNAIEQDLTLVGATAIEDKLQDGVPEAIANLARASIKIWVLTGDKQETAINIGYSSKLLTENMRVFIINADDRAGVQQQLQGARDELVAYTGKGKTVAPFGQDEMMEVDGSGEVGRVGADEVGNLGVGEAQQHGGEMEIEKDETETRLGPPGPPFGIVINGHSLRHALKIEDELLDTAGQCQAVICCRVTPLQKKKVVDLVKKKKKSVTLAIGDGANDVGMIKAAHIGVGISGQEGQQAVLASDYSFGQFRYLERLLLVHGRWSYHRMVIFLRYFFYKNFAFSFSQFLFAWFCGFSAQTLYDPSYIAVYNVIYTALPILALSILDQDVDEDNCYRYPQLYIAGQQNKSFNRWIFLRSLVKGIYVAIVLFFILMGMTLFNFYPEGYEWDYQSFGLAASGALTIIVNLQIAMDTFYWNPIMHIFVWGSIIAWFVVLPVTSSGAFYVGTIALGFFNFVGVFYEVFLSATFWFYWPLATVIALGPTIIFRTLRLDLDPHLVDDVRLKMKKEGKKLFRRFMIRRKPPLIRTPSTKYQRSGYAFSHQEGFAKLILSGRLFGLSEDRVARERFNRVSTIIRSAPSTPELPRKEAADPGSSHLQVTVHPHIIPGEVSPPMPGGAEGITLQPADIPEGSLLGREKVESTEL